MIKKWPLFSIFSKIFYLFMNNYLVPFKVIPLRYNTLILACFDFSFISSIVAKPFPFIGVFSFGKRKKSAGAKSGGYCIWGMITVLFLSKNSRPSIDVQALVRYHGAKFMIGFLMNFFEQSAYNLLTVRPCDNNSWCTTQRQSKKTVSKTFIFDRT